MNVQSLKIKDIKLGENCRMSVAEEDLSSLMLSIKEHGLLQPVGVIKRKDNKYVAAYGNRRILAMSRLGRHTIDAVVLEEKDQADEILKNLTENTIRSNISIAESGRMFNILNDLGLKQSEIAARLGVTTDYVKSCLRAYAEIPKKYLVDIVRETKPNEARRKGLIAFSTAKEILNARKKFNLTSEATSKIFEAAKSAEGFKHNKVYSYAKAIKAGKKQFMHENDATVFVEAKLTFKESDLESYRKKYIEEGPFKTNSDIIAAVLTGQIAARLKCVSTTNSLKKERHLK